MAWNVFIREHKCGSLTLNESHITRTCCKRPAVVAAKAEVWQGRRWCGSGGEVLLRCLLTLVPHDVLGLSAARLRAVLAPCAIRMRRHWTHLMPRASSLVNLTGVQLLHMALASAPARARESAETGVRGAAQPTPRERAREAQPRLPLLRVGSCVAAGSAGPCAATRERRVQRPRRICGLFARR